MANNPSKHGVHIGREDGVGASAGPRILLQSVEAVAAETGPFVAVVFGFDGLHLFVEPGAHADAQRVGQAHEANEFFELAAALQVRPAQGKAAPFQVLKTGFNGPALAVKLAQKSDVGRTEQEQVLAPGQGVNLRPSPDPVDLARGQLAALARVQAPVGHGVAAALAVSKQVVLRQAHDEENLLVLEVLEPRMAHKFPVAHHQPHPVGAQCPEAKIQQRGAVSRVGIAAAVVEQFPVQRLMALTAAHRDEQNVDLALAEVGLLIVGGG